MAEDNIRHQMTTELRFSVYLQATAVGGTFNICQCSIVVWSVPKVDIQISQSSIETGNLFGATPAVSCLRHNL